MEQPTTRPGSESESLLRHSSFLLSKRDFTNSRKYALLAQQADPNLSGPDQILAVTNVFLAAERRLNNNYHHLDWYSILQIPRPGPYTRPEIQTQFEKLSLLLNPIENKNNKVPFIEEAFKLVYDAWLVLSDPYKKTLYDNVIDNENVNGCIPKKAEKTQESDGNGSGTFWTVCPYCYNMFEYEKKYEECALRCQNCRRAFHGVAVPPPRVVEGVEGMEGEEKEKFYYHGVGLFPLGYRFGGDYLRDKKGKSGGGLDDVVEISDDSGEENGVNDGGDEIDVEVEEAKEDVVKGGGEGCEGDVQGSEKIEVRNVGKRVMKNFKSVARKSKKIMGKGVKSRRTESMVGPRMGGVEFGSGSGNGNWGGRFGDEVEFF